MQRRQTVIQNIRWLAAANIAVKPLWFLFLLVSTRLLGPTEFGRFMFAISYVSVIAVVFEGGIDMFSVRQLSSGRADFTTFFSHSSFLKLLSCIVVAVVAIGSSYVVDTSATTRGLIVAALIFSTFNTLMVHFRFVLRSFEVMKYEAQSIFLEKILVIILCGIALSMGRTAWSMAQGYAVAYTLAAAATLVLVARQAGMPQWKIDWRYLVDSVLKPALPFALMSFFMIVYFRAGTLMIGLLTGRQDLVGYYNAGYRLVESYMLFPSLVLAPLYPVFARNLDERPWIRELLLKATRIVLVVSVIIAVPMSLFRREFTLLFYGTPFEAAAPAVGIVTLSMIPVGMTWVYGTLVAASGRQGRANVLIFLITIVNILLNYILIPVYLEIGAAITTLVTEVAVALVSIWIIRDFIGKRSFLVITGKAALVALLVCALHEFSLLPGPFWLQLAICLCVMSAAFFALRLVTLADLKKIGFGE